LASLARGEKHKRIIQSNVGDLWREQDPIIEGIRRKVEARGSPVRIGARVAG
jgi:hypothetical protein